MLKKVLTVVGISPLMGNALIEQMGEPPYVGEPQNVNNDAFAKLVGKKAEMWARKTGKEPPITDTQFAEGCIVVNEVTGEVGLILNVDDEYYQYLPDEDKAALVEVVAADGWIKADVVEGMI
jgi:hypothetical protein